MLNSGEDGVRNDVGSDSDVVTGNEGGGRTTVVTGNEGGESTTTACRTFFPPAFIGRNIPFPNVGTDAGKLNGCQILRVVERIGWDVTMNRG